MKKKGLFIAALAVGILALAALSTEKAAAQTNYYYIPSGYQYYQPTFTYPITNYYGGGTMTEAQLINYLQQLILKLQAELANKNKYYQTPNYGSGSNYVIGGPRGYSSGSNRYNEDDPDVYTNRATNIHHNKARLHGEVDMNDFEDGEVFFVYGEDEDQIEDVDRDYDSYRDIDEDGNNLRKVRVDSRFDGRDEFDVTVNDLDSNTDYYFQICVGFEDEYGDDKLICGGVKEFTTNRR